MSKELIEVTAERTKDGWVLITADDFHDILAGPMQESALDASADKLGLKIRGTKVGQLLPRDLFRVGTYWYRLVKHEGRMASVVCIGENKLATLQRGQRISELSVLNKK